MAQKSSKGNHGHADHGSKERGNQKAVYGSSVSPEVSDMQQAAIEGQQGGASTDQPGDQQR